jgi:hypothetical protein
MGLADLDRERFVSITICRSGGMWQASLETVPGSFRVRVAYTPSEALDAVLNIGVRKPAPWET